MRPCGPGYADLPASSELAPRPGFLGRRLGSRMLRVRLMPLGASVSVLGERAWLARRAECLFGEKFFWGGREWGDQNFDPPAHGGEEPPGLRPRLTDKTCSE